jgi:hypothetical protein
MSLNNILSKRLIGLYALLGIASTLNAVVIDFESLTPDTAYSGGGAYWNGSDTSGSFTQNGATFSNSYNTDWSSWDGFAYSTTTDTSNFGFTNQYSAYAGNGANGSDTYGIYYVGFAATHTISFDTSVALSGMYVTNTTYTAGSMLNGDAFAKKFGGVSGADEDWYLLTVHGWTSSNVETGSTEFYLADYRFADSGSDYIQEDWAWLDLTVIGTVDYLTFELTSSDSGLWGMNTPGYFALDEITPVPEPSTIGLILGLCALLSAWIRKQV